MASSRPLLSRYVTLGLATLSLLGLTASRPAAAQQRVMNFDGVPITAAPTTYTQNGITLQATAPAGSTLFNAGNPSPGYVFNTGSSASALFTLTDGLLFTANSIDVQSQGSVILTFTGTLVGGATVTDTFTTNGSTFQTYSAPARFANLQSFRLGYPGGAGVLFFDNVRLTPAANAPAAVPEPAQTAALGMGLLGLAGLVMTAKKRKASASIA